ncbi:MAG: family N-acetyltransferase, partial [Actinomycetota bacterium]|nr:family N-acetyltransferase [Actinomycetota bacterium]
FFCESGTLGATFLEEMAARQLGLSTFISPGMRVDVSSNDLLQYWETDDSTSVVLLYLQGLGNPRKFARIVRRLSRRKPVLAVLTGRVHAEASDDGQVLPDNVVDELLGQCGVLQTRTIGGLLDVAALLAMQPIPRGPRVALVSNSTALLMHTMDLVDSSGMHTVQRPYRVTWDADGDAVGGILRQALEATDVDAVIVIHVPPVRSDLSGVTEVLRDVAANSTKPLLAVLPHETGLTGRSSLVVNPSAQGAPGPGSVPVYGEPAAAVAALALAVQHAQWLATPVGEEPEPLGIDEERAERVIDNRLGPALPPVDSGNETAPLHIVRPGGRHELGQHETIELFASYGLELWPSFPVESEAEAAERAAEIGYPVVLKTASSKLVHRTDLGGVRLSLENERALRTAFLSMVAQHPADVREQLLIQAMAPPGVTCAVVTREDRAFGPVMALSVGGFVSDLVEDWAYWMPPLTDVDAQTLIRTPRTSELLFGYQGSELANVNALAAVLMRVARMAEDWPQIQRLEINPMLVTPTGCYLLGASVQLVPADERQEMQPRRM